MSTSRNWKLEMQDYINDFGYAPLLLLHRLLRKRKTVEFTWKGFQDAVNSELVSIFGNFVNRTWVLMHKLCGGKVPKLHEDLLDESIEALEADIKQAKINVENFIEEYRFRDALFEIIDLSARAIATCRKRTGL